MKGHQKVLHTIFTWHSTEPRITLNLKFTCILLSCHEHMECVGEHMCVYACACLCVCAQAVLMLGHVHVVSAEFILPSLEFQTSQQHPTQPMVTHHIHQPTQTKPKLFTCLSIMQSISSIKSKNTCNICPTRRHTHNMINILHC